MKLSKVLLILSCWFFTALRATITHENSIDNTDRGLNKRKLLGECEGNCNRNSDCAYGNLCSRRNRRELKSKGYDPRLAFCKSDYSKDGYVCYNPWKAQYPACPAGISFLETCDSSGNGYFNGSNTCLDGSVYGCCRPVKEIYNETHNICEKHTQCNAFEMWDCFSDGSLGKSHYDSFCSMSTCMK